MKVIVSLRIVALCLVGMFSATDGRADGSESDPSVGFGHNLPGPKDAAFYRSYAQPEHESPKALETGRWVLETDRKTRLSYPRLVSLTGGGSAVRANAALEAIHGWLIKRALKYHRELMQIRLFREEGLDVDSVLWFDPVKVTYLSSGYLAVAAIGGERTDGNGTPIQVLGVGIDIHQGTIFSVASCREGDEGPFFTFGSLLTVCDQSRLKTFRALWREQVTIAQDTAPRRQPPPGHYYEECRGLAGSYIDVLSEFSVYPTPRGLAVHNTLAAGLWQELCVTDPDSPFFPTIIPWPKLAPLLNPGPWRDELLSLH